MEKNAHFTIQLLDRIGAPLLSVIENVAPEASDEAGQVAQAEIMAQLLAQTTAMSTMLYSSLDIKEDEQAADQTRIALASLVAPFVAEFYLKRKKIPQEDNLKRMIKSLEAVLLFGDNFKPAVDGKSRLQTMDSKDVLFDKDQPTLVMVQAMVSVINAVEEFSFGEARPKLIKNVATKLQAKAEEISKKQKQPDKFTELLIFKALAGLYADCHRNETRRVLADSKASEKLSAEPVWNSFDVKVKMIEVLLSAETADDSAASTGDVAPTTAPAEPPQEDKPAAVAPPPSGEAPATPVEAPPAAAGPMGFFGKKPEAETAPATPPAEIAPAETPAPPAEAAATPPATDSTESDAPPAGPMGFFKKKEEE